MKKWLAGVVMCAAIAGVAACGGGGGGGGDTGTAMPGKADCTPEAGTGVVCGNIFAADGTTPLANAEVRLANAAASLSTKGVPDANKCVADPTGAFACVVPTGTMGDVQFVIIFTGFDNKPFTANIVTDQTTTVANQVMTASAAAKWVVVPGSYDGVQVLLAQLKGCTLNDMGGNPFDPLTMSAENARASEDCTNKGLLVLDEDSSSPNYPPTFLTSSAFTGYNALFINCDADYSGNPGVNEAIQSFESSGKHVYFSDLSDDWLSSAFPGKINFFTDDPYLTNTGTLSATVVDTNLAAVVGNPINIVFDLPVWAAIDSVASGVNTYIEGDLGSGGPISSYTGVHPITVGWRPTTSSGCIFYTSYHIEGASTGAPQELAIKYLVQNIGTVCK